MPYDTVYLNGAYVPLSEAKISVLDRGFLFGDGVYEVIPAYGGQMFHFSDHIQRLQDNLDKTRLLVSISRQQWLEILTHLLSGSRDEYIYLQVTRGVTAGRNHEFPDAVLPTVFAMCSEIQHMPEREQGVKVMTLDDTRWELCHVKATTLLANILLRQTAVEQQCAEAILIKDNWVTEGAASNIFAVLDNELITPPTSGEILPGITRVVIIKLAQQHDIKVTVRPLSVSELQGASEIWLTSSTREIVPVVTLDDAPVGAGKPGPFWLRMQDLFQSYKKQYHE